MDFFFVLVAFALFGGLATAISANNLLHATAYGIGLLILLATYLYAHRYKRRAEDK